MSAPLSRQLFPINTPEARVQREIDSHYHAEMIAQNTSDLVGYQRDMLRMQHEAAVVQLQAMGELAQRQDQANGLLSSIAGSMAQLESGLDDLNYTAMETLDAVTAQTGVLEQGFNEIAKQMAQQHHVLLEIAELLRRPYETQAQELLREADRALQAAMGGSGREQKDDYDDAMRLLDLVIENPIGSRNYVAWFQKGWLQWKHTGNLPEAEECFYTAQRLSRSSLDLYHVRSVRHLAYMKYRQGRYDEAYDTIQRAVEVAPDDHDVLYDKARYAARTNRQEEALQLLGRCIDQRPHTIVTMFAEEDFLA